MTGSIPLPGIGSSKGFRAFMERSLEGKPFEVSMAFIILFNLFVAVYETDAAANCLDNPEDPECGAPWTGTANNVLMAIYITELVTKLWSFRMDFFSSAWNRADLFIVFVSVVADIVGEGATVSILRTVRILKLCRILRQFQSCRELYSIIHGTMSVLKAVFWSFFMQMWVLTMWSVLVVQVVHPWNKEITDSGYYEEIGCERCPRAFSSVLHSNLTFFQTLIAGDSWGMYHVPVIEKKWPSAIIFAGMLSTIVLGLMNLVLAVIVESSANAKDADEAQKEHDAGMLREKLSKQLYKIFKSIDQDDSGEISMEEVYAGFESKDEFHATLKAMDVDIEDIEALFVILDDNRSDTIPYKELCEQLLKIKSKDSYAVTMYVRARQIEILHSLETMVVSLKADIASALPSSGCEVQALLSSERKNLPASCSASTAASKIPIRTTIVQTADTTAEQCGVWQPIEESLADACIRPAALAPLPSCGITLPSKRGSRRRRRRRMSEGKGTNGVAEGTGDRSSDSSVCSDGSVDGDLWSGMDSAAARIWRQMDQRWQSSLGSLKDEIVQVQREEHNKLLLALDARKAELCGNGQTPYGIVAPLGSVDVLFCGK